MDSRVDPRFVRRTEFDKIERKMMNLSVEPGMLGGDGEWQDNHMD